MYKFLTKIKFIFSQTNNKNLIYRRCKSKKALKEQRKKKSHVMEELEQLCHKLVLMLNVIKYTYTQTTLNCQEKKIYTNRLKSKLHFLKIHQKRTIRI